MPVFGVVVIGRNEGERLERCLRSLVGRQEQVVYVDSDSSDGSVEHADELGAAVVRLDAAKPFTAARARNEGLARLIALRPDLRYVQFVDGDCEVQPGWLDAASGFLDGHPDVAVVCGRRRERDREASWYNRLADMEWDTPVGEAQACGGDAMMRVDAFQDADGYRTALIAGEDPELCVRIREAGFRVFRLDQEMTLHDAAIYRFGQWWQRNVRAGHAYAESAFIHRSGKERYCQRQVGSIVAWAVVLPAVSIGGAVPTSGVTLVLLGTYGVLWARILGSRLRRGDTPSDSALYATFCVIGKFAELQGVAKFAWNRWIKRKQSHLIEYKTTG